MHLAVPRLRHLLAGLALVALCTCDSLDNISVDAGGTATIPKRTLIDELLTGPVGFLGFDQIDFSQQFKNQGVTKEQVDAVHLESMTLTIAAPASGSFDFLDEVAFYAEAKGQPKVKIAAISDIPPGARELDLQVNSDVDLTPYVTASSMTISSEVKGERPEQETQVEAAAVLDVDIHIPGCN